MQRVFAPAVLGIVALVTRIGAVETPRLSADSIEYFEKNIRPILVDTCYKCHSAGAEKLKGGLYLDTKSGALKGGKTGPAVVPSDLDKSLLIKAVRYTDEDLQMPPKQQLSKAQIAALETWVKMGAQDPRGDAPVATGPIVALSLADSKNFWSFKKPVAAPIPQVKNNWARSPIDAFIFAKLQEQHLVPAPTADKRTLIRRATFDLTGLPPTSAEVAAFEADTSAGAFEKVIDRLLASPAYGERWARHWLDVARYADTKGYVFQEERRYPFAYTYRDWVVNALNADMPYDQFLINQIAADRVGAEGSGFRVQGSANTNAKIATDTKSGTDTVSSSPSSILHPPSSPSSSLNPQPSTLNPASNLAAMGFLTVGRRFLNNQADIIDDRLDVLCRGTMALTVACARCHDHKFDPIPTADYYSLYGIFASSVEPKDLPLLTSSEKTPQVLAYEKELASREADIVKFKQDRLNKAVTPLKTVKSIEAYLLSSSKPRAANDSPADPTLNRFAARRWRAFLERTASDKDAIFAPWHQFAVIPEADFAAKAPAILTSFVGGEKPLNSALLKALTAAPLKTLKDVAAAYAQFLEAEIANPKSTIATASDFPTNVTIANVETIFTGDDRGAYNAVLQKRDAVNATHPGAPARAMVLAEGNPVTPVIFKRGNPAMRGAQVPRQFLAALAGDNRKPFKEGSGRLELAKTIASKDNPLTARVFVNRVWLEHFGKALVRTPSDFGVRGDRPTHPELLDYLAVQFMENGWSIKKLQKTIMLSAAYQQSSQASAEALQNDAENRWLSHQNRQRLDFEAMRDSLLFASGQLDTSLGGRAVDILTQPFSHRRTIYGFVDRQNLPNMFRAFDFASPDQHAPMRFSNTVPQQALFMMNSPFIIEQSRSLTNRTAKITDAAERIRELYRLALERNPSNEEIALGQAFVNSQSDSVPPEARTKTTPLTNWEKYAQVLLQTNEFVFVD